MSPVAAPVSRSTPMRTTPLGVGDLVAGFTDEGDRGTPVVEPAEVADERAGQLEAERALQVPGGEHGAVAQVDDPFAGLDPPAQFGRIDRLGRGQVRRLRPSLLMTPMCA